MGSLGVVDEIEVVDLGLELLDGVGEGLLVEIPEQGLVDLSFFSLRGRLLGFPVIGSTPSDRR